MPSDSRFLQLFVDRGSRGNAQMSYGINVKTVSKVQLYFGAVVSFSRQLGLNKPTFTQNAMRSCIRVE